MAGGTESDAVGMEGIVRYVTEQLGGAKAVDAATFRTTAAQVVAEVTAETAAEVAAETVASVELASRLEK